MSSEFDKPPDITPAPNVTQPSSRVRFRLPIAAKIAILFSLLLFAAIGYYTSQLRPPAHLQAATSETDPNEIAARQQLPDFILTDAEGVQKKLSDFRGNIVILSFWASWCTPCLMELPTFAEIEHKFHERGLRVIAVNVDDGDDGKIFAHDFWAKKSFPFINYFDPTRTLEQQLGVDMLPSNFIIDRQGRLVFKSFGANDWSNPEVMESIENLLNESVAGT